MQLSTEKTYLPEDYENFCSRLMQILQSNEIEFMVGGAFSLRFYTGVPRFTKDLDLFIRPDDSERALQLLSDHEISTHMCNSMWLGKAFNEDKSAFVDFIFRSGNGLAAVDDLWFRRSEGAHFLDLRVMMVPPEEFIWSKAFTMERDRFDLADILHMILKRGHSIDWRHLLERFRDKWPVLYVYLVLFRFSYPSQTNAIPDWVTAELTAKFAAEQNRPPLDLKLCRGTLLSRTQFDHDVEVDSFLDARFYGEVPESNVVLNRWKKDLAGEKKPRVP